MERGDIQEARQVNIVKSETVTIQAGNQEVSLVVELVEEDLNYRLSVEHRHYKLSSVYFGTLAKGTGAFYRLHTMLSCFKELHLLECTAGNKWIIQLEDEVPEIVGNGSTQEFKTLRDIFEHAQSECVLKV